MNNELRICGRLTKNKKPCRNPVNYIFDRACPIHATDEDKAITAWAAKLANDAYNRGVKHGKWEITSAQEYERRTAEAKAKVEAEETKNFKLRTSDGCQIIRCGNYAYVVPHCIPDLSIGDVVCLPPNWLVNHCTESEITALGTSYTETLSQISGVVKRIN